jgi:hypothetical protein
MSVLVVILIALAAGFVGGVLGAAFMEAYLNRRATEQVGAYEVVDPNDGRRTA